MFFLLRLYPSKAGRFLFDVVAIDSSLKRLRRRLTACRKRHPKAMFELVKSNAGGWPYPNASFDHRGIGFLLPR